MVIEGKVYIKRCIILKLMQNRNRKLIKKIVTQFQQHFSLHLLSLLCMRTYQNQSKAIRKKYNHLFSQLTFVNARSVQNKKQEQLLQSWLPLLQDPLAITQASLSNFHIQQLIKMLDLLSQWKQKIQLLINFLNQVSQGNWIQLKKLLINHNTKYSLIIQTLLKQFFKKKQIASQRHEESLQFKYSNYNKQNVSLSFKKQQLSQLPEKIVNQKQQNLLQKNHNLLTKKPFLRHKNKNIIFNCKNTISPNKLCSQQTENSKIIDQFKLQNDPSLTQDQSSIVNKGQITLTTFHKTHLQTQTINQSHFEEGNDDDNIRLSLAETIKDQAKLIAARHKSNIENLHIFKKKNNFSSFKRLERATNLAIPDESSSAISMSSNSKKLLKSNNTNHPTDNFSKKSRISKNSFSKYLQNNSKRNSKTSKVDMTKQQLLQIDQSQQFISDQRQLYQQPKQNSYIYVKGKDQRIYFQQMDKKLTNDQFFSTKYIKDKKYKRRLGISTKGVNSVHSLDSFQNFLSSDSKKQAKNTKSNNQQNRSSFFRSSGHTFQQQKSVSKNKYSRKQPKKLKTSKQDLDQVIDASQTQFLQEEPSSNKIKQKPQSDKLQGCANKNNKISSKQMYKILTQINEHERNDHNLWYDQYYQQLLKRKYSNGGYIHQYNDNQIKPSTFKLQIINQQRPASTPITKVDCHLVDFMNNVIRKHQSMTIGQLGTSYKQQM